MADGNFGAKGYTADDYRRCAEQGFSQAFTASVLGVTREAVRQMANRYSIEFEDGRLDLDAQDRVEELHAEGHHNSAIAKIMGRNPDFVNHTVARLGLEPNPKNRELYPNKHDAALREMAAKGFTQTEAAKALGIHQPAVCKVAKELGLTFRDGRVSNPVPRNVSVMRLVRSGYTYSEVASTLNMTRCAVAGVVHRARVREDA